MTKKAYIRKQPVKHRSGVRHPYVQVSKQHKIARDCIKHKGIER